MILLVDVGNSRVKWAWARAGGLTESSAADHGAADLAQVLEAAWSHLKRPARVVVSSVAGPAATAVLTGWCVGRWRLVPEVVVPTERACGVRNAYADPASLGADRWAGLVGAWTLYRSACCVVDCGTAVTIDALSPAGEHLGGLILPGLAMMRRALLAGTEGVRPTGQPEVSLLARNTAGAVAGGTLYGLVAALDRIALDLAAEIGGDVRRVLTGGDAPALLGLLGGEWHHRADLVLQGLARLAGETPAAAPALEPEETAQ